MLTASPITNQTVGKTFSFAVILLGLGAALQVLLIGWALVHRPARMAEAALSSGANSLAAERSTRVDVKLGDFNSNPFGESLVTQTATPAPPELPKPRPVSVRGETVEPMNRFEELILQGKQLRERGDMNAAITKFREAGTTDPKNTVPLAELAATYEKMALADKAAEQWRKIYDMGDDGNWPHALAKAKLEASQANALRMNNPPPSQGKTESVDLSKAEDGILPGCILGLLQITTEEKHDDTSAKHFVLHIPIKARPKAHIEVRDLVIHVLFYDLVDGQNVVQTSANVSSRWATPPADWVDSDTEELAVEYQLPKPEARAAKRENRKYFGYIVRIYYKQRLQAAAADPERLAQQYPAPPTLPKENDK